MPHIHTFSDTKPDMLKNAHLRKLAEGAGSVICWTADIYDCGESIGDIEAVAILQPGTPDVRVWVGWEGGDGEEFAEMYSLMRAIRDFARESIQIVVDEI